jgi:GH35 family endo-1,4-beta-xylanase
MKTHFVNFQSLRQRWWLALGAVLASGITASAFAATPDACRKAWDEAAPEIDANIERYRKGDATIEVVDPSGQPVKEASLEIRQKSQAFLFGCNLFVLGQLDTAELNRKYEEAFAKVFNFATVPFYWGDLEPQQGKLRYGEDSPYIWRRPPTDRLVEWCKAHGITAKGHALMYSKTMFMPGWINRNDPEALKTLAQKRMTQLAQRYGRDIAIWDVVNEEIPRLANPAEWHAVPNDYLAWCFAEAGQRFPKDVKLLINDGTSQAHVTTAQYEQMIQGLLARKLRVEGIGIQFHAGRNSYLPRQMMAVYERLGKLGLPLYITEITIPGTGKDGPELQAREVANLYRLWFSTPQMAGVTWWNLGDGTAFRNENQSLGGLIDKNMDPKPAYQALDKLINHEWRTNLSTRTNAEGKAQFRGFEGKYAVKATAGSIVQEFELELSKAGAGSHRLTFKK